MRYIKLVIIAVGLLFSMMLGYILGSKHPKNTDAITYSYYQGIMKEIDMQLTIMELLKNNDIPKGLELIENWTDLNLCQIQSGKIENKYTLNSDDIMALRNLKKYRSTSIHEVNKALKPCVSEILLVH